MMRKISDLGAPYLIFSGEAVDVGTGSTDPPSFDDHGLLARLRQVPREVFSTLTASNNQVLTMLHAHRDLSKQTGHTQTELNP